MTDKVQSLAKELSPKKKSNADLTIQVPDETVLNVSSTDGPKQLLCIKCHQYFEIDSTVLESRVIEYCIPCYRNAMIKMTQQKLIFRPNHIEKNIYLGGHRTAENLSVLQELNISRVLIIGSGLVCHFPDVIDYYRIEIEDQDDQNISQYFLPSIAFIDTAPANVLVHCHAGVSRSASLVVAYFMHNYRITLQQAIKLVKAKRSCISPNFGFMLQLKEFEKQLTLETNNDQSEEK